MVFVDESGLNAGGYLAQRGRVEGVLDDLTIQRCKREGP